MAESLLLCATRVLTFSAGQLLTAATAFFFRRGPSLYLVTSGHVLHDPASGHQPDRIEFLLHVDRDDLTRTQPVSLPLYVDGQAVWRQGTDSAGPVDIAVLPLQDASLPPRAVFQAFGPEHLLDSLGNLEIGALLLVVGFPLSFFDTVHQLPVARHATIASAFGVRFQGQGYFLTDARLHRGASGAPVVARDASLGSLPWRLLGVHSSRMDMAGRDGTMDETLGLNAAWYADMLLALTEPQPLRPADARPRRAAA